MKKFVLLAFAGLLLSATACKTQTCPAYSKTAPVKPTATVAKRV